MKKKRITILAVLLCISLAAGCGKKTPVTVREFVKSSLSEETQKEPEEESEEEKKEPKLPEEEAPYVEDSNIYGNNIGNLYSFGMMVEDKEKGGFYFYNEYAGLLVYTDIETGNTEPVWDQRLMLMNLWEGKLYGVELKNGAGPGSLISLNTETGERKVLWEDAVSYLQIVNGELYFTDEEKHQLRRMNAEGGEEEILTEEMVDYPVAYKDMIIFQRSADGHKLYRMNQDGGEMMKLNEFHSYNPIVYHDKIYYTATEDEEHYTLRRMNLDGSGDTVLDEKRVSSMQIHGDKLYYDTIDQKNRLLFMDLTLENPQPEEIQLEKPVQDGMREEFQVMDLRIDSWLLQGFAEDYLLVYTEEAYENREYAGQYLYQVDTKELLLIPVFCVNPDFRVETEKETSPPLEDAGGEQLAEQSGTQKSAGAGDSKEAQARAVAQAIADSIPAGSDLERVRAAAAAVAGYCNNAIYTTEDPDYRTAYGLFCKGVYTCAGSTRALGMVLECMGYSWTHANANQWTHQWCELTMDGQPGWADGMGGIADYGVCPFSYGGTYTMPDGSIGHAG